jgi:hypothetical protein
MKKDSDGPRERRRGRLKNGNTPGDFGKAPRCEAKTRAGTSCQCPAMANGRCHLHGGKSTGPRTPEGLYRCKMANWKTGVYSAEACASRKEFAELIKIYNEAIKDAQEA